MRLKSEQQASKPRTSSGTSPLLQTPAGALPVTKVTKGSNAHKRQLTYVTTRPNSESFLIYLAVFARRNSGRLQQLTRPQARAALTSAPATPNCPHWLRLSMRMCVFFEKTSRNIEEHSRNTRGTHEEQLHPKVASYSFFTTNRLGSESKTRLQRLLHF